VGPMDGRGVRAKASVATMVGTSNVDQRCGFGCGSRLFSDVSLGLPWLICCCEVEATVARSQWRTMTSDRWSVRRSSAAPALPNSFVALRSSRSCVVLSLVAEFWRGSSYVFARPQRCGLV
jgi:hypothetical protein